jgi:hypothetical protein
MTSTAAKNVADLGPCRFAIDDMARLLDMKRAVLRQWIHRGYVTPAIKGRAGGRPARKSFFSCQQAIALAITRALYGKGFLDTGGVKALVDSFEKLPWATFAHWMPDPKDAFEAEIQKNVVFRNGPVGNWVVFAYQNFGEDATGELAARVFVIVLEIMYREGKFAELDRTLRTYPALEQLEDGAVRAGLEYIREQGRKLEQDIGEEAAPYLNPGQMNE